MLRQHLSLQDEINSSSISTQNCIPFSTQTLFQGSDLSPGYMWFPLHRAVIRDKEVNFAKLKCFVLIVIHELSREGPCFFFQPKEETTVLFDRNLYLESSPRWFKRKCMSPDDTQYFSWFYLLFSLLLQFLLLQGFTYSLNVGGCLCILWYQQPSFTTRPKSDYDTDADSVDIFMAQCKVNASAFWLVGVSRTYLNQLFLKDTWKFQVSHDIE